MSQLKNIFEHQDTLLILLHISRFQRKVQQAVVGVTATISTTMMIITRYQVRLTITTRNITTMIPTDSVC